MSPEEPVLRTSSCCLEYRSLSDCQYSSVPLSVPYYNHTTNIPRQPILPLKAPILTLPPQRQHVDLHPPLEWPATQILDTCKQGFRALGFDKEQGGAYPTFMVSLSCCTRLYVLSRSTSSGAPVGMRPRTVCVTTLRHSCLV